MFSRIDRAVIDAAECWATAMGGALRELTPEAADFAGEMYLPDLPGRSLANVRETFRAAAARETKRIEAERADLERALSAGRHVDCDCSACLPSTY